MVGLSSPLELSLCCLLFNAAGWLMELLDLFVTALVLSRLLSLNSNIPLGRKPFFLRRCSPSAVDKRLLPLYCWVPLFLTVGVAWSLESATAERAAIVLPL